MTQKVVLAGELAKTIELRVYRGREHIADYVVYIYHDSPTGPFYPVVLRRAYWRLRPFFVNTVADEECDVMDALYQRGDFERDNASAVLAAVVRRVRASFASSGSGVKISCAELAEVVEIGPYDCPGQAPWYFIIRVLRDLSGAKAFFPIVFRRDVYRLQHAAARASGPEQMDIVDGSYVSESFARSSAGSVKSAVLRHIQKTFGQTAAKAAHVPAHRAQSEDALSGVFAWEHPRTIELVKTVEIQVPAKQRLPAAFVIAIYKDLGRRKTFFPIVRRRDSYRIKPSFNGRYANSFLEVVDCAYDPQAFEHRSERAVLDAVSRQIARLG